MVITMTREDILRRLETRLEVAKAEDKRAAAEHKKAEQAAEKKYKDMIRAHLSLDWKTLKKAQPIYVQSPSCPRLQAPYIQSKIDAMKHREAVPNRSEA